MMEPKLPAGLIPGIVNIPGRDPQAQAVAQSLLEEDRRKHHCIYNPRGFHNHLSHHLLAAYDLGAPAALLRAIYDAECQLQKPINGEGLDETPSEQVKITSDNFAQYVGQEKYYHAFLAFFTEQIKESGAPETIETFIFSPAVNTVGIQMLVRFMSGLYHPLIQTGYGAEFRSDAMIAQGLAQASVHSPMMSGLLDLTEPVSVGDASIGDGKDAGKHLLNLLREFYNSEILKPTPYDPNKSLAQHRMDVIKDGRSEAIKKLCASWWSGVSSEYQASNLDAKVEELFWANTLLFCGTGKQDRKPRLDFILLHAFNATLFLPSLLKIIPNDASKVKLLKAFLCVTLMYALTRGRPRIDAGLAMSYTVTPRPPGRGSALLTPGPGTIGNPNETYNPWLAICASVIHAPDAHAVKAIRTLYYAAQHYGHKGAQDIPGCFDNLGEGSEGETFPGSSKLDGTLFVRAAGVVMNTLGWVTHGDKPGDWDRSGLGWDEAWEQPD